MLKPFVGWESEEGKGNIGGDEGSVMRSSKTGEPQHYTTNNSVSADIMATLKKIKDPKMALLEFQKESGRNIEDKDKLVFDNQMINNQMSQS